VARELPAHSPLRERRVRQINAVYEARQALGYPVTLEGNAETLQVAREVDGINWLTVKGICEEGVLAGLGDVPGLMFVQTTSNRRYYMTFNEALAIIRDLRSWGLLSWDNWNRLKGAARDPAQTPTAEALAALDIEEGWP
jgi:hypothetical protein